MNETQQPLSSEQELDRTDGVAPLRQRSELHALLLAVLVTALVTGFVAVVQAVTPRPSWRFLYPVTFLIALESVYTTHWIRHPERRQLNRGAYRLAEYAVIAVLLRLLTWGLQGEFPGAEAWRGYFLSPLSMLDSTYGVFLLAALFAWERGITFSTLFDRLALSHAEIAYYSLPEQEKRQAYEDRPIDRERPRAFSSLIQQWLGGGFMLALTAAITTVEVPAREGLSLQSIGRLGLPREMLAALLVYFLLGLWVISQARLTMMRSRWIAEGVDAPPQMMPTWNRAALTLLLLVAFVAAFLPIGSTIGFARLFEVLMALAAAFVQLLLLLFSLIVFLVLSLLGRSQEMETAPTFTPPRPTPPPSLPAEPLSASTALVLGIIFWAVVAVVAVAALAFFIQDRGVRLQSKALRRWWERLRNWLRSFWQGASRQATTLTRAVRTRLGRQEGAPEKRPRWRFIRVNALPPREQVRYFYLSTVRRAGEQGVSRAPAETPSEYARALRENWPEAEEEIEALTGAFLEARYSRQPFTKESVNPIKRVWKRVRAALRRRQEAS